MNKLFVAPLFVLALLLLASCEKEMVNPYDRACPAEVWSPTKLQLVEIDDGVEITWENQAVPFDGYWLERSSDSLIWTQTSAQLIDSETALFVDTLVSPGQIYYSRIFGVADLNRSDTAYAKPIKISPELALVRTNGSKDISNSSAEIMGLLLDTGGDVILKKGFYWSDNDEMLDQNDELAEVQNQDMEFNFILEDLQEKTTYYYAAFAENSMGAISGETKSFTTHGVPDVKTDFPTNVEAFAAQVNGILTFDGGSPIIQQGFYLSAANKLPNETDTVLVVDHGLGNYFEALTGLDPRKTYYYRAFAENKYGTALGRVEPFSTLKEPWNCVYSDIELTLIPAGVFEMGNGDVDGRIEEKPVHQVILDAFQMSTHEITVCQFIEFLNDIQCNPDGQFDDVEFGNVFYVDMVDADCPVTYDSELNVFSYDDDYVFDSKVLSRNSPMIEVSWFGANAYCKWKGGRLPTEAEWEYAARANDEYRYAGSDNLDLVAWYDDNSPANTHPVGGLMGNSFGLFDMSGNVREWCSDFYDDNYYNISPINNPQGPENGTQKVIRGGGYDTKEHECTVFRRDKYSRYDPVSNIGFRIVID